MRKSGQMLGLFVLVLGSLGAHSASVVIVTDQRNGSAARALKQRIESENCFRDLKRLRVSIRIVASLECKWEGVIVTCADREQEYAKATKADKVIFVKDGLRWFTATGTVVGAISATTSATANNPTGRGVHEFLHALGFADEYTYDSEDLANQECRPGRSGPNFVFLKDESPYVSDESARAIHAKNIPWYSSITAQSITSGGFLGTTEPNTIGLYPLKMCKSATNGVRSFRPWDHQERTIMEDLDHGIPDYFCPGIRAALKEPSSS